MLLRRSLAASFPLPLKAVTRSFSISSRQLAHHKIIVVGAGTGGITVAAQLQRSFEKDGRPLVNGDLAIVDPARQHHYQPGWTLAGTGLANLADLSRPTESLIPEKTKHYNVAVKSFSPEENTVTTTDAEPLTYDYLVVAPGLQSNFGAVEGLKEALADKDGPVSSIYNYETIEKAWKNISTLKSGTAIFTQPAGIIKCAGAPQKVLWMAESQWRKDGTRSNIKPIFATGMPTMFGVPKYSDALNKIRQERNVEGLFAHSLVAVDGKKKVATFATADGKVEKSFDLLHVVPPQGPLDFIKGSPIVDAAGWVSVDNATLQHTSFSNIFSLGDASSTPNSKTAAAISVQAPILVANLRAAMNGQPLPAKYDGYASCPLLTGHNELMLAEFKYGGVPSESFASYFGSQDKPRALYYWLKKNFFPWVYWKSFVKGTWYGPKAWTAPVFK